MKVLVINPGATSTKIAVFEEETEQFRVSIDHSAAELKDFERVADQMPYRKALILDALAKNGVDLKTLDAVCGRGGLFRHIPSGTYAVNDLAIQDILHPFYGEHAANLGAYIAREIADPLGIPAFFVDPVCVDELSDLARVSGLKGMVRESFFHALNQKSVARKAAKQLGKPYEELNLIVLHLGGGVSVAAHEKGMVVDNFNVKDDGAMGLDRGGALPVNAVVNLCFSGKTKQEIKKLISGEAGVYSYLGTKDFREIERRALSGDDPEATLIFKALAYQLAKDAGALAAVMKFRVDAIVYTGGMAYSKPFCDELDSYLAPLAPVLRFPGEEEMKSLAEGALRVLHGGECKTYLGENT
ncbi:MAG: butyrate kinase [Clostridia bacterium]|nr:butyrate kinase [Clostridia bacterium]